MHQLAFKELYDKKASLTFRSMSKMQLKVNELHYVGRRQAVCSNPLYIYTLTNTHRSIGACKRRQSASEILHPTQSQVAEVGCACGGRPSSAVLCEGLHHFSWEEPSSKNQTIPEKGPVQMTTALPFSSGFSEVPTCPSGLSGRLQRTEDRHVGTFRFRLGIGCSQTLLSARLWDKGTDNL